MEARVRRVQALNDHRRALILRAARSVFDDSGIEGASIREIARRAGYTPGAIYSYFDSKEAIYGALLAESLERLNAAVTAAEPAALQRKARAWFDFYAAHPRELDLGFYLVHGMAPRGLTSTLDHTLNARLYDALAPVERVLQAAGMAAAEARRENTALFAHGVGLLLLKHTGRIRMFGEQAEALFDRYLDELAQRVAALRRAPRKGRRLA